MKKKDMQLVVNDYIDFTLYIVSQSDKRSYIQKKYVNI